MSNKLLGEFRDGLNNLVSAYRGPGRIWVPPHAMSLATGLILPAPNSSEPGKAIADSEAEVVRWLTHAAPTAARFKIFWSEDLDNTANATLNFLVSKGGATVGDATTLLVSAFNQINGAAHDADADFGGTTNAVVGDLTAKTTSVLSLTLLAANLPVGPASTSFTVKPTNGTLGTDNFNIHMTWVNYTKKAFS